MSILRMNTLKIRLTERMEIHERRSRRRVELTIWLLGESSTHFVIYSTS